MSHKFDPTKPCCLREDLGKAKRMSVRIVAADKKGDYPVVAIIEQDNGTERAEVYTAEGTATFRGMLSTIDLVNIPEPEQGEAEKAEEKPAAESAESKVESLSDTEKRLLFSIFTIGTSGKLTVPKPQFCSHDNPKFKSIDSVELALEFLNSRKCDDCSAQNFEIAARTRDAVQAIKRALKPTDSTPSPDTFWIVWNPNKGPGTVKHKTHEQAVAEAERIGSKELGKIYVLQAVDVVEPQPSLVRTL